MSSCYLREEHLANSNHASPSSIAYIAAFNIMVEHRKACSISEPRNGAEFVNELLFLLLGVFAFNQYLFAEQVEAVTRRNRIQI
jgi:hypothetical protein